MGNKLWRPNDNNGSSVQCVQYSQAVYMIAHAFLFFKQMRDYGKEKEEVDIS